MMQKITDKIITSLMRALIAVVGAMPPRRASDFGGALARAIGPLFPPSKIALANLAAAMPELDEAARQKILRGVWENLGRTVAEMPHLAAIPRDSTSGPGLIIKNQDIVTALQAQKKPMILFSAHFGNWEVAVRATSEVGLRPNGLIYRAAQNQAFDLVLLELRDKISGLGTKWFPKGAGGARAAMALLKSGGTLLMLADQKMNDGIEARFFNLPAMSPSALAAFALRFDAAVIPAACLRTGPARIEITIENPLSVPRTGNHGADVLALTQAVNDRYETWIRAHPEQWLWLHRRWPNDVVKLAPKNKK